MPKHMVAVIWLILGIGWWIAEWSYFHGKLEDGTYGGETFYIVFKIIVLTVFSVPGTVMLLVGAVKIAREIRK